MATAISSIMLTLICYIGKDRYAIEARRVVEVVPLVELKAIARSPEYVAGLLNYRGQIIPVIDLSQLLTSQPSRPVLSTRIIIVEYKSDNQTPYLLGLIAERLSDTLDIATREWINPGIQLDEAQYLGDIITDDQGMIQYLQVESLLSEASAKMLIAREGES